MPKVSVVIPCYNNGQYLRECLDSVLNQTFSDFEVLVVDDGSTDNCAEIAKSYGQRLKYLRRENKGPAAARNAGIEASQTEYIAFQDADDLWYPEKLELQIKYLEENSNFPWVYSDMSTFNDRQNLQDSWFSDRATYQGKVFEKLIFNNFIPTITVLVKKKALLEVGGFDQSLRSCEDKDLWLRLALKHPLGKLDRILARRRFHSHNLCRDNQLLISSEIKVMENLSHTIDSPGLQNLLEKRISKLYFELGYFYFARQDFRPAREFFKKSRDTHTGNLRSSLYLYSTYLDQRLINWIKFFKNSGKASVSN